MRHDPGGATRITVKRFRSRLGWALVLGFNNAHYFKLMGQPELSIKEREEALPAQGLRL